ncbi:hypothetical protein THAOC_36008 [Thalassiosira oceanica]|uniref:HECT-type E3 ubiquitin transferase n=1 Tax=Thalassiosira oceanica TaxID=159749 RepID=K0R025_THAOC|nr:hypothetical protein THAOC_36008 [Thalassiosira oceanica]|eukprot:EJK45378.1 hypothetical protein THAOC_36008 [Thalassiosira oceanica]
MNPDDEQGNVQEIEDARIEELRGTLGLPADFSREELAEMLRQHDRASAQFETPRPRDSPTATPTTEEGRRWVRCQHPTPRPGGFRSGTIEDRNFDVGPKLDEVQLEMKRFDAVGKVRQALNERLGYDLRACGQREELEWLHREGEELLKSTGIDQSRTRLKTDLPAPPSRVRKEPEITKITVPLPMTIGLEYKPGGPKAKLAEISKLSYEKDGWTRTIRPTDMKFQWTRSDENGGVVNSRQRFDDTKSAYVLKLDFHDDDDDKMRHGSVSLVTPEKGGVDSNIKSFSGQELVSYQDIANVQNKSFEDKIQWFQETCSQLCAEWNEGHMRMNVRREYLLSDSMEAVMSLGRKDLRKVWRFEFIDEAGIDDGGLAREWFELVTDKVFDPDMGLWQTSASNQMCMQINPASEIACPEDHLIYFRFIGRIMGKAMFDGQLVKGRMVKHLYKHILGWPVMFSDLKDIDEEYYNSLKGLKDMGADIEYLYADFTTIEETLGVKRTVELVPGGVDIDVTEENLPEYMKANLKYRLLGRYEKQLNELLLGIFDVIPAPLLTIFDFQELELLMCGLPEIDIDDWKENTEYSGGYDREGPNHEVCVWFWEIVSEYDQELKARLLQFVTGSSGAPARGFSSLQGINGRVMKFTIHGVALENCGAFPSPYTKSNRIDLPIYGSKDELGEKLKIAITMAATGFDIE